MIYVVLLGVLVSGVAVAGFIVAFVPGDIAKPWDEIPGSFGDWSEEAKPEPLDWAKCPEWRVLRDECRRRPESLVPVHIERRRSA